MNNIQITLFMFAVLFGPFLFVYGEIDDSPGGQFLGLFLFLAGIVGVVRSQKKGSA